MSIVDDLTPINLLQEKEKFFANQKYNPQFIYEKEIDKKTLTKYGLPEKKVSDLATAIVEKTYFGRNEQDLFMLEGARISQQEASKKIKLFLNLHKLDKRFDVVWSSSFVSRAMMTSTTLRLRLPVDFHKEGLIGMIYHEIGTHALRRINYEQQPWYKKKKEFGFGEYLTTEEGLAVLHALIPHSFKSAFIGAIRYIAVNYSQQHSFVEVWNFLSKYIQDLERRWIVTIRTKRGIEDTATPGGFTKDLVYLDGLIRVSDWLKKNNFDPTPLYFGKLDIRDVGKAIQLNPNFQPQLPTFFTLDPLKYMTEIQKIIE